MVSFERAATDVWSFSDISQLIEDAQNLRGEFPVYAVLNNADVSGSDNNEAIEAISDYPALKYLDAPVRRRKSIATSAGKGLSVFEHGPKDAKACEEIQSLINIIFK